MRRLASSILLSLLLAGCGADPTGSVDLSQYEDDAAAPAPGQSIDYRTDNPGRPDQAAIDRLIAMQVAHRALKGLTYVAHTYVRGHFGTKPSEVAFTGGAEWEGRTTWEAAFTREPAETSLKAVESTIAGRKGLRVTLGATKAVVRFPGLRGLIAVKRDLLHADLLDFRGNGLSQLLPTATVVRLAGSGLGELAGRTRIDGEPVDLVAIPRSPSFDSDVTREVLAIDSRSGLLRRHAMYVGPTLVYEQTLTKLQPAR